MKHLAIAIAAVLSLSLVAPVFAQPFADVPADHWAFDAIAELAAKGILEGYPDGTFKGDRAMTRYEMAMALARILARIEAVQKSIPPPVKIPPPEVRRADIDRLQRLINEFRAELSALGVRITAIEEDLAAVRARLDNTRVTGDVRIRYNAYAPLFTSAQVCPAGFTPLGAPGPCQPIPTTDANYRARFTLTGRVTPTVSGVVRIRANTFLFSTGSTGTITFDRAYLDASLWGATWRVGRQGYTLSPIGASGYGLLFDPDNIFGQADGLVARATYGGFNLEGGLFRTAGGTGDFWVGRAESGLIPGFTFGVSVLSQRQPYWVSPLSLFAGNGWSFDVVGTLVPGIGFGVAYATFDPTDVTGVPVVVTRSSSAWTAWVSLDLGRLGGLTTLAPTLDVWYKNYGHFDATSSTFAIGPSLTGAITEFFGDHAWNFKGWGTQLNFRINPRLSGTLIYETGSNQGTGLFKDDATELFVGATYSLAPRTSLSVNYRRQTLNLPGVPLNFGNISHQYRLQISTSF